MSALDPYEVAEIIKDVIEAALDDLPTQDATLSPSPDRVLQMPGENVDDCPDQVVVVVGEMRTKFGRDTRNVGWIYEVDFDVTLSRCVPVPEIFGKKIVLPTVAEMEQAAKQISADGWATWNALQNAILRDGALPPECGKAAMGKLSPRNPSGGVGGWSGTITLTIDGYDPPGPGS